MKKLLGGAAAALAALLVVLVVRALTFESRQVTAPPAAPLPALNPEALGAALAEAVRCQTVSHQDPAQDDPAQMALLHGVLAQRFPLMHAALQRDVVDNASLLFTWKGRDPAASATVLMAHLDVVPVDAADVPAWEQPPFEGVIRGGVVWGRGSVDDKSGVVATLGAVEALLAQGFQPRGDVLLALGHDEEVLGTGAPHIMQLIKSRGHKVDLVMDEGLVITDGIVPALAQPMAVIGVSQKGYLTAELTVEADGGHSSMPEKETAVGILSRAVSALERQQSRVHVGGPAAQMLEYAGAHMAWPMRLVFANLWLFRPVVRGALLNKPSTAALLRTTTAPTVLQAGVKENVVPRVARALVNFRVHPLDTLEDVTAHVAATVADERVKIRVLPGARPATQPSPTADDTFRMLQRTLHSVAPEVLSGPGLVVGATDARHYAELTQHIYMFRPTRMTGQDTRRIHGLNERLPLADLERGARFYAQLLRNLAEPPAPEPR